MVAAARVLQIISVCSPSLVCHGCLGCFNLFSDLPKDKILKFFRHFGKLLKQPQRIKGHFYKKGAKI